MAIFLADSFDWRIDWLVIFSSVIYRTSNIVIDAALGYTRVDNSRISMADNDFLRV